MQPAPPKPGVPLLTDEERITLESIGQTLQRPPGHLFVSEGEETDFALLIKKGQVKVVVGQPPAIVAIRKSGDMVGEMAAIRSKPRSASIIAMTEVEVLRLAAQDWIQFLYAHPRAMHGLLYATDERVDESTRKVAESEMAVEQRLAKSLLELADSEIAIHSDAGVRLPISQNDLASLTRASSDSIKKIVRGFKARDLVTTGRNSTTLRDVPRLASIADGTRTVQTT